MRFLARRLGFLLIALWAAMTVNFLIPRLMPGNPAEAMMGRLRGHINPASLKALEVAFGINTHQSLISSYFAYLNNCVHLNFGISLLTSRTGESRHRPSPAVVARTRGVSTILGFLIGTMLGAVAAWRRGGALDSVLPPVFIVISAFPYFFLGLLFIWFFGLTLGWFPILGDIPKPRHRP